MQVAESLQSDLNVPAPLSYRGTVSPAQVITHVNTEFGGTRVGKMSTRGSHVSPP